MHVKLKNGELVIDLRSEAGDAFILAFLQAARDELSETLTATLDQFSDERQSGYSGYRIINLKDTCKYLDAMDTIIEYYGVQR